MAAPLSPSRIRQRIDGLLGERRRLESALMRCRGEMRDACLVARRQLAGGRMRKTPAYYLSRNVEGKTQLSYVRKEDVPRMQRQTDRWRRFSSTLAEWVKVSHEIERLLRALGRCQVIKAKEK